jgi:putative FmdB family regulatory protein
MVGPVESLLTAEVRANMPIYEYECTACGHIEEIIQKFSDKPLTKCPQCAGKLTKLISQSSFHLKGSGWYVTDYAKKSSAAAPPKKDKAATKTEKKGTTAKNKTDSAASSD